MRKDVEINHKLDMVLVSKIIRAGSLTILTRFYTSETPMKLLQ